MHILYEPPRKARGVTEADSKLQSSSCLQSSLEENTAGTKTESGAATVKVKGAEGERETLYLERSGNSQRAHRATYTMVESKWEVPSVLGFALWMKLQG